MKAHTGSQTITRLLGPSIALVFVSAIFLWVATTTWPQTPDGFFHLQRVRALSEALAAGVLYPRWFPDFAFGYGYPVLHYYAPAFYYPPALLHLLGLDLLVATRLTLALFYALGGLGVFWLLAGWAGTVPALAGAVLYQVFPYRLYDLFVRGALPEFAAFLWLPWIAYFMFLLVRRSGYVGAFQEPITRRLLVLATLCWAGLILTHNLTAFMAAVALVIAWPLVALSYRTPVEPRRVGSRLVHSGAYLLMPLALAGLASAWYTLPALMEARWVALGAGGTSAGYVNHFATIGTLFDWSWRFPYPDAAAPTVPLPGYVLAALLGAVALALWARRGQQETFVVRFMPTLGVITAISIWLTTAGSAVVWDWFAAVLSHLQFPWRWQTLVTLGTALLGVVALTLLPLSTPWRRNLALVLLGAVCIYGLADLPTAHSDAPAQDITVDSMWAFDREMGQVGATWAGEFLPNAVTEPRWAIGREPSEVGANTGPSAALLQIQPQQAGYLKRIYVTQADAPVQIRFHRFFFPAWTVELNGERVETTAAGALGLLSVDLPAGEHSLSLRWQATTAVWIGRALSTLGWLLVLWLIWTGPDARRRLLVAGWLGVGAIGLLSISGVTTRAVAPVAINADFGAVRLEAASPRPMNAGSVAGVRLYWTIQAPQDGLVAFVHVVDSSGIVVAQHDELLAGVFTPPARLTPGLVLEHEHLIVLPPDLPPGSYTLKAGVYPTGRPNAPLIPAGADEARVTAGRLIIEP